MLRENCDTLCARSAHCKLHDIAERKETDLNKRREVFMDQTTLLLKC